jgi:hypothetical protein
MRPATIVFAISGTGVSSGIVKNVGVMMSRTCRAPSEMRRSFKSSGFIRPSQPWV